MHPKERAKLKRSPNQPATLIPSLRTATSIAANGLMPGHVLPEMSGSTLSQGLVDTGGLMPPQSQHRPPPPSTYHLAMTGQSHGSVASGNDAVVGPNLGIMPTQQSLQHMKLMLEENHRVEEKRKAKRAANRKSACTSRARKKQYVENMTMANQSLKHHAQIMDLLPDLIIGVDRDGIIHYVSKSVLSRLQYSEATMLGASFHSLCTPDTVHVARSMLDQRDGPMQQWQHQRGPSAASSTSSNSNDNTASSGNSSPGTEGEMSAVPKSHNQATILSASSSSSSSSSSKQIAVVHTVASASLSKVEHSNNNDDTEVTLLSGQNQRRRNSKSGAQVESGDTEPMATENSGNSNFENRSSVSSSSLAPSTFAQPESDVNLADINAMTDSETNDPRVVSASQSEAVTSSSSGNRSNGTLSGSNGDSSNSSVAASDITSLSESTNPASGSASFLSSSTASTASNSSSSLNESATSSPDHIIDASGTSGTSPLNGTSSSLTGSGSGSGSGSDGGSNGDSGGAKPEGNLKVSSSSQSSSSGERADTSSRSSSIPTNSSSSNGSGSDSLSDSSDTMDHQAPHDEVSDEVSLKNSTSSFNIETTDLVRDRHSDNAQSRPVAPSSSKIDSAVRKIPSENMSKEKKMNTKGAIWSSDNLKRHNEKIDQLNETSTWKLCLIRRDRSTLMVEAVSNVRKRMEKKIRIGDGPERKISAEIVLSLRPVGDGSQVDASLGLPDKPDPVDPAATVTPPSSSVMPVSVPASPSRKSNKRGSISNGKKNGAKATKVTSTSSLPPSASAMMAPMVPLAPNYTHKNGAPAPFIAMAHPRMARPLPHNVVSGPGHMLRPSAHKQLPTGAMSIAPHPTISHNERKIQSTKGMEDESMVAQTLLSLTKH